MKLTIAALAMVLIAIQGLSQNQIRATTADGKKVILSDDGTWKYDYSADENGKDTSVSVAQQKAVGEVGVAGGSGVIGAASVAGVAAVSSAVTAPETVAPVGAFTVVEDSAAATKVDSAKAVVVVPPPKPKPPPNLNCSALVNVQWDLQKEQYVALSREIPVTDDSKTGYKIVLRKTKKSPVTWTTTIIQGGCIQENSKMLIVFQNGGVLQIPNDGKPNCNGIYEIMFGGDFGKEEIQETLKKTMVTGLRIMLQKGYAEHALDEESMLRFRAAMGCMPK